MTTTYGRSSLGYLWALLEPLGAIILLSVAFSLVFNSPPLGVNFPLFYATGYIPFIVYSTVQQRISTSIRENYPLLFYPTVNHIDAVLGRFILTFVTQVAVAALVYLGIFFVFDLEQPVDLLKISTSMIVAASLGLGVGTVNTLLFYYTPSWQYIWGIINRPLFLASCIFYLFDSLPLWAQKLLWYNPLIHIIGQNRRGFYTTYDGLYVDLGYPTVLSLILICVGVFTLQRVANDMLH